MRKKFSGLLVALLVIVGFQLASPVAAHAAPGGCPTGTACLWTGGSYTGSIKVLPWSTYQGGGCYNLSAPFDTDTSSAYNDYGSPSSRPWRLGLYSGYGCGGAWRAIYGGTGATFVGTSWDNQVRSFRIQPL
jgi:hypothetical protein